MSTQNTWLWPDHPISTNESRKLREEHNSLVNVNVDLLAALEAVNTERDFRVRCNDHIQGVVSAAIAKAKP